MGPKIALHFYFLSDILLFDLKFDFSIGICLEIFWERAILVMANLCYSLLIFLFENVHHLYHVDNPLASFANIVQTIKH